LKINTNLSTTVNVLSGTLNPTHPLGHRKSASLIIQTLISFRVPFILVYLIETHLSISAFT